MLVEIFLRRHELERRMAPSAPLVVKLYAVFALFDDGSVHFQALVPAVLHALVLIDLSPGYGRVHRFFFEGEFHGRENRNVGVFRGNVHALEVSFQKVIDAVSRGVIGFADYVNTFGLDFQSVSVVIYVRKINRGRICSHPDVYRKSAFAALFDGGSYAARAGLSIYRRSHKVRRRNKAFGSSFRIDDGHLDFAVF